LTISRDQFIQLMRKQGIECGVHYKPVYELSYYAKRFRWPTRQFPNTAALAEGIVSIPIYPDLSDAQINRISKAIHDILLNHRRKGS
jgi:dTDP-4-amino-4,6-dideoxygalactose transaminase